MPVENLPENGNMRSNLAKKTNNRSETTAKHQGRLDLTGKQQEPVGTHRKTPRSDLENQLRRSIDD
jgi:hypothetical protein